MTRIEHQEQIERWAKYVRENQNKLKQELKPFIDAQIIMARRAYAKLAETEKGRKKIVLLKNH